MYITPFVDLHKAIQCLLKTYTVSSLLHTWVMWCLWGKIKQDMPSEGDLLGIAH